MSERRNTIGDWSENPPEIRHPEQCQTCRHFRPLSDGPSCTAYPAGIPFGILDGRRDHRRKQRGDNGIQWEPKDGETEASYPTEWLREHQEE